MSELTEIQKYLESSIQSLRKVDPYLEVEDLKPPKLKAYLQKCSQAFNNKALQNELKGIIEEQMHFIAETAKTEMEMASSRCVLFACVELWKRLERLSNRYEDLIKPEEE